MNFSSAADHSKVSKRVQGLCERSVIEKAPGACVNCISILCAPKKSSFGEKGGFRACFGLRLLDPRLKGIDHCLPKIFEILDVVESVYGENAQYTTQGIKDSCFRFRALPEDKDWSSFRGSAVRCRLKFGHFGINLLKLQFQRVMDKILGNLPNVAAHVNDIAMF